MYTWHQEHLKIVNVFVYKMKSIQIKWVLFVSLLTERTDFFLSFTWTGSFLHPPIAQSGLKRNNSFSIQKIEIRDGNG